MEAFAIFCGMGIHNTHMYEKAIVAMAKQSVTLEVLSYHASASTDDALRLMVMFDCCHFYVDYLRHIDGTVFSFFLPPGSILKYKHQHISNSTTLHSMT